MAEGCQIPEILTLKLLYALYARCFSRMVHPYQSKVALGRFKGSVGDNIDSFIVYEYEFLIILYLRLQRRCGGIFIL